jgi:ubiquitin-activating enzyme E1-like protein 2
LLALYEYIKKKKSSFNEFEELVKENLDIFKSNNIDVELKNLDIHKINIFRCLYFTSSGKFPPLCSFLGGVVAQEVLKSITNKFSPLNQFFHFDCIELFEVDNSSNTTQNMSLLYTSLLKNDRFDNLRVCFGGNKTLHLLRKAKIFMVGCGAIGCEMLKNYALLNIGCNEEGLITITDNDLIEKSNLNRQFLFRQRDIQKSKSLVAAREAQIINENIKIQSFEKKVSSQTENDLFTDQFFCSQDLVVNALDNVESRRYMDNRCVASQRPLLETGTLGTKGKKIL